MKLSKKIKKAILPIEVMTISLSAKLLKADAIDPLYGIPKEYEHRPKEPLIIEKFLSITKNFIIPIIGIIGIIIYLKKSKSSKVRKIVTTLIIIVIVLILYFVINNIV